MRLDTDATWMNAAAEADPVEIEISFLLRESFPTDTSSCRATDWPTQALDLPSFPRRDRLRARSHEVEGHASELAAYYRRAKDQMVAHHASSEVLFWLSLEIAGPTPGMQIGFAWWDRLSEMRGFLDWIENAKDGQTFDDLDQGWAVQAARRGDQLYFRHTSWEEGKELGKLRASVSACRAAALATRARIGTIVRQLTGDLGGDYWS